MRSRKVWALVASLGAIVALQIGGWADPESLDAIETVALGYMGANVAARLPARLPNVVSAGRRTPAVTSEVAKNRAED